MLTRATSALGVVIALSTGCEGRVALRVVRDGGTAQLAREAGTGDSAARDAENVGAATQCPAGTVSHVVELTTPVKLDLLFMIDDSGSMHEEQANLARNFPRLINELKNLPMGFPDLHLGVVSSDLGAGSKMTGDACGMPMGDGAVLQVRSGCGLDPKNGRYLISENGGSSNNFDGDIANVFACLAKLGTDGCGFEHQLQSVRMALSGFVSDNDGFLRPDAHLAVVYITDEDDCSAPPYNTFFDGPRGSLLCSRYGHVCDGAPVPDAVFSTPLDHCSAAPDGGGKLFPVQTFIDDMKGLHTQSVTVSVIGGWPNDPASAVYSVGYDSSWSSTELIDLPICKSANGEAYVGLRMKQFVDAFGPAGKILSICEADFSSAMAQIGRLITTTVQNTTVECQ